MRSILVAIKWKKKTIRIFPLSQSIVLGYSSGLIFGCVG
jgi:hypothetical protein